MNFNSMEFCLFFIFFITGFALTMRRTRARNLFVIFSSYMFYAAWDWRYLSIIIGSTIAAYLAAIGIEKSKNRSRVTILTSCIIINLTVLAIFKYFNFFIQSSSAVIMLLGIKIYLPNIDLLLPIGISFYTFEVLSYVIDVYYKKITAEKNFITFAAFVAFFPKLVAGPIIRASDFLPQLNSKTELKENKIFDGLTLVFRGLFKKILIADIIASWGVDAVFQSPSSFSTVSLWIAMYGYAVQIYCDFSGYTDIAIGLSRIMGFEINQNFNRPYQARTPSEFWRRWHISLSSWLRDYLYIPLGGNRMGRLGLIRNLMITMLLGGLWHGAAWHFVLWGAYHGALLVIALFYWPLKNSESVSGKVMGTLITFQFVCFGWVLFRAPTPQAFYDYFRGLFILRGGVTVSIPFMIAVVFGLLIHIVPRDLVQIQLDRFNKLPVGAQAAVYLTLLLLFAGVSQQAPAFIYFQF